MVNHFIPTIHLSDSDRKKDGAFTQKKIVIGHIKSNLVLQLYKGSNYETNKTQSTKTNKKIKPMTKTNKKKTRPQQLGSPIFLLQGILSLYMMFLKIFFLPKNGQIQLGKV